MLSKEDIKRRLAYCKEQAKEKVTQDFWSYRVSFYLDGTGFVYMSNPHGQGNSNEGKRIEKCNGGPAYACTSKDNDMFLFVFCFC